MADIIPTRAGIHTESVVAGVVGLKKNSMTYGEDAVNTASRKESYGSRGKIKEKGLVDMYFVQSTKPFLKVV